MSESQGFFGVGVFSFFPSFFGGEEKDPAWSGENGKGNVGIRGRWGAPDGRGSATEMF